MYTLGFTLKKHSHSFRVIHQEKTAVMILMYLEIANLTFLNGNLGNGNHFLINTGQI